MKHTLAILSLLATIFTSTIVKAQNEGSFDELYMKGKWTGSCPIEILDHASMHNCPLCPFVNNYNNVKGQGHYSNAEMNFLSDSIVIKQDGKITTVPYKRNKKDHSFTFTLNNKEYHFRVFFYGDKRIIENSDGLVMVLEKEE